MLRDKKLTNKLIILGIDDRDSRVTKRLLDEGKLPKNINYKFIVKGEDER